MKKIALAGVVVLAAALGWSMWATMVPATRAADLAVASVDPRRESGSRPDAEAAGSRDAGARHGLAPREDPSVDSVVLRIRWSDGTPAADATAWMCPRGTSSAGLAQRWLRADAAGTARSGPLAAGAWSAAALNGGKAVDIEVRASETVERELTIPEGLQVEGRVVDPDDRPVAGAKVAIGVMTNALRDVAESAADGTFRLRSVEGSRYVCAFATGRAPVSSLLLGQVESGQPVVLRVGPRSGGLRGRVVSDLGQPIAGATVLCGMCDAGGGMTGQKGFFAPRSCQTDANGEFTIEAVPGAWERVPLVAGAPGFACRRIDVVPQPSGVQTIELRLDREATLTGTVRLADGTPCARADLWVNDANSPRQGMAYQGPGWDRLNASADEQGRFRVRAIPAGRVVVSALGAQPRGRNAPPVPVAVREFQVEAGATLRWDPVIDAALAIVGSLVDHRGEPLSGWRVVLHEPEGTPHVAEAATGPDGGFRVAGCADVDYTVKCYERGGWHRPGVVRGRVRPGPEPLRLIVPHVARATCFLVGVIHDADGQPVADGVATCSGPGGASAIVKAGADGSFRLGPLPAGEWEVDVRRDAAPAAMGVGVSLAVGRHGLVPDQTRDLGVVRMPLPARIEVRAIGADGDPVAQAQIWAVADVGRAMCGIAVKNGAGEAKAIAPGRYTMYVPDGRVAVVPAAFTVNGGETTRLAVKLVAGERQVFRIEPVGPEESSGVVDLRDQRGELVRRVNLSLWHTWTVELTFALLPGRYTARFTLFDGRRTEIPFRLVAGEPAPPITVSWPK